MWGWEGYLVSKYLLSTYPVPVQSTKAQTECVRECWAQQGWVPLRLLFWSHKSGAERNPVSRLSPDFRPYGGRPTALSLPSKPGWSVRDLAVDQELWWFWWSEWKKLCLLMQIWGLRQGRGSEPLPRKWLRNMYCLSCSFPYLSGELVGGSLSRAAMGSMIPALRVVRLC